MKIIGIINQKGGVGKTTTSHNLAYAISKKGYKTLLVDFDPQGNLTQGLNAKNKEKQIYIQDILNTKKREIELTQILLKTIIRVNDNLSLIPANINLASKEKELLNEVRRENKLEKLLKLIENKYDFVIIDSSPSLGLLTLNVLFASNYLIVPFKPEYYSLEGINSLLESIENVREEDPNKAKILGYLASMVDARRNSTEELIDKVRNDERTKREYLFKTIIKTTTAISDASKFQKSVFEYKPTSPSCEEFLNLADEVIERIKKESK